MKALIDIQTFDPRADDLIVVRRTCSWCKGMTDLKVSRFLYKMWREGTNIQDVWPHVPLAYRETMQTGYHDVCFEAIFAEEES